jgi:hypothetical protein
MGTSSLHRSYVSNDTKKTRKKKMHSSMVGLSVSTTITETSSLHRSYFSNDTMKKKQERKKSIHLW